MARHPGKSRRQTTSAIRRFLLNHFFATPVCSFFLLLLFCSTASAVRFDVFVGFNGAVPEGNWFPVACEIQNDGPPFNGIIEISSGMGGGQARRIPLELTLGATKRVVVPVFSSSRYSSWTARLLNERGKIIAEQNLGRESVKNIGWGTPFIAALSRSLSGAPVLPPAKNKNQPEQVPIVTRVQTAFFPDNPIALEGMGTLYLNSETALDLKTPQVDALLAWIDGGGHLIVCAEQATDVNATPWLKNLLPCELGSTAVVKPGDNFDRFLREAFINPAEPASRKTKSKKQAKVLSESTALPTESAFNKADLPIIAATVREGETLLEAGGHPLIAQKSMGRGRVTALTFSSEREPFLSWTNRGWFWAALAEIPAKHFESTDYNYYGGSSLDGIFGAIVDSKQVRKLPLTWLLVLLLVYLVIIGPFDRWWLKKINRPMLTWITFPTYVVCFSALIYFIGFKLRAGDSEWNEIQVVDVLPQSEGAVLRGRTFASIYSPSNARYPIASEQPFATLRGEYMANNYGRGGQENSQAEVVQRGNSFVADVSVPVWTSQMYISDWLQTGVSPVTVKTSLVGPTLQVTIVNHLDHDLKELRLVFDGRVYNIGEAPEGEKQFTLEVGKGQPLKDFVRSNGNNLHNVVQQRQNTFGDNRTTIANIPMSVMAASFVSQLDNESNPYQNFLPPAGMDLSRWVEQGDTVLLAWDPDHTFAKPINKFNPRRLHRDSLLRLVIPKNS